jgi:hypothetical protein
MRRIYTALVAWNLAILAVAGFLGAAVALGMAPARAHELSGLFAALFGCLVHSLLIAHFIGSMKWIQQTGPTAGMEEAESRPLRRAWVKGRMFPVVMATMAVTAVAGMTGGGTTGWGLALHVVLAAGLVPLNLWALALGRRGIDENLARMRLVGGRAEARVAAGLVREEDAAALLPESGRAGGKVLVFLGVNVWVLWAYVRFVLRHADHPALPYAVASAVLVGLGVGLLRTARG